MISSAKKYPEQAQASNRILMGTSIEGDLLSDGDVRIDGKVKGTVKISGKLVVGEHGVVEGEVECKNAAIAGTVEGTFKIAQTLSIAQWLIFSTHLPAYFYAPRLYSVLFAFTQLIITAKNSIFSFRLFYTY